MNVLSLFDGMSCGRIALERCGIEVTNYFASEVDKYAIQVSKANWPDIKHIGDVRFLDITFREGFTTILNWLTGERYTFKGMIDLIIGGSPCQGFSFAGKQLNFNDLRSALFFEYERLRNDCAVINPQLFFFLENVVMKQAYQDVISELLGVQPIFINSALVSAQMRKRLYWTNIPFFSVPSDRNIILKDILEFGSESVVRWQNSSVGAVIDNNKAATLKASEGGGIRKRQGVVIHTSEAIEYMNRKVADGRNHWDFGHHSDSDSDKSSCITANIYKGVPYNMLIDRRTSNRVDTAVDIKGHDYNKRVYSAEGKSPTVAAKSGGNLETKVAINDVVYRKITLTECERLQNVPEGYTQTVSNTQAYKMLGNGWECNTISYLFTPLSILELL